MLRKTESRLIYLQQLGRGLRTNDDEEITVYDFPNNYLNIEMYY